MTNITVKQLETQMRLELSPFYPHQEVEALVYHTLRYILNLTKSDLLLKSDTNVPKTKIQKIEEALEALKKYKPLQYILGETAFYGLTFRTNEKALIPRPETEELVDWVLTENAQTAHTAIDLGTGSGCIAIAVAKFRPQWKVSAADLSEEALQLANENALLNQVNIEFRQENLLELSENLKKSKFDLILSNPPYVTWEQKDRMHANVLENEPHMALFAPGNDPLIFYRKIAQLATTNLNADGKVYLEINEALPEQTAEIFKELGFCTELKKDINEKYRMLKAFRL